MMGNGWENVKYKCRGKDHGSTEFCVFWCNKTKKFNAVRMGYLKCGYGKEETKNQWVINKCRFCTKMNGHTKIILEELIVTK